MNEKNRTALDAPRPFSNRSQTTRAGSCALALFALALPALFSGVAAAEDVRLTPPLVLSGEVGNGFWAYGQIDKGALVYDDGDTTKVYPLVDNENSSTRAGLWFRRKVAEDFTFSANLEAQWTPYSSFSVNRANEEDVDWGTHSLR